METFYVIVKISRTEVVSGIQVGDMFSQSFKETAQKPLLEK